MTQNDIMEELSTGFINILAHNKGYFNLNGRDYGTDLHIRKAKIRKDNGKGRYLTSGRGLDVQLKAVNERYITITSTHIKYSLESKNFNDLIDRLNDLDAYIPLILIVFIFPDNVGEWVNISPDQLILKKCAYWYAVDSSFSATDNSTSITINVPKENIVDLDLFPFLFNKFA